jgi:hypothetical protein
MWVSLIFLISFCSRVGAMASVPVIECKSANYKFMADEKVFEISKDNQRIEQRKITSREVRGVGKSARTIIGFERGELSYFDQQGCVSKSSLKFSDGQYKDLSDVKCVSRGVVCP